MPPKRKSIGATMPDGAAQTPSKRLRSSPNKAAGKVAETSEVAPPKTGEKRKRGRPRKNPETTIPQASDTPKRGRGRPPKIVSGQDATAAAAASPDVKRGRGRPRKSLPAVNTPSSIPQKGGRGRPRKSLPAKKAPVISTTPKGRGRPRKSLPAPGTANVSSPKEGPGRPRKSLSAEEVADVSSPKKGRGRPRKSLGDDGAADTIEPKPEAAAKSPGDDRAADTIEPEPEAAAQSEPKEDTGRSYWLMKAEPESRLEKGVDVKFSIDDLAAAKEPEPWDGVRNAVARNIMRDMKKGDYAFFYHSNCKVPGVVGIMEIVQEHSADESAFDPKHPYYDPKSDRNDPKWSVVHVEFRHKLNKQVTLADLKANGQAGKPLENLQTLKQSRLSVTKVTPEEWRYILQLAGEDPHGSKV